MAIEAVPPTSDWGIIISAVSAAGAIYAVVVSRKKVKAEAESVTVGSASQLVETVMKQLDYLDNEVEELRKSLTLYREQVETAARTEARLSNEIHQLRRVVRRLLDFIIDHGLEPPFDVDTQAPPSDPTPGETSA